MDNLYPTQLITCMANNFKCDMFLLDYNRVNTFSSKWVKMATYKGKNKEDTNPICLPAPVDLFHDPSIACMTINATESGSVHDTPLNATANCARGASSSLMRI